MFCMDHDQFQLIKTYLGPRKLEKSPFLNIISYKYMTPYWDTTALAHIFKSENMLKSEVYICNNDPKACVVCSDIYKKVEVEFLYEIRDVVERSRKKRASYLFNKQSLEDRIKKQNSLLEELSKEYTKRSKTIEDKAEATVLKLRCAPPLVHESYNYNSWKPDKTELHSFERNITDEDRGIPQMSALYDWYRRRKECIEEEYKKVCNEFDTLLDRYIGWITQNDRLKCLAGTVLLHNPQYNVDEELLKWSDKYKHKECLYKDMKKQFDSLLLYSGIT